MMNPEKPLISVIIPIYNVKDYLPRCLDSVLEQTYKNLEIWLVDDGSSDGSGDICDEYGARDDRIQVIHQVHEGVSEARNAALDRMRGEYVTCIDSDDFVHREMIHALYETLTEKDADIAACGVEAGSADSFTDEPADGSITVFDREGAYRALFDDRYRNQLITVWGKLYRSRIFDGLRYEKGKIHEDEFIIHHVLERCEKVAYMGGKYYYYYARKNSITKSGYSLMSLQSVEAIDERCSFFENLGDRELMVLCFRDYLRRVQFHYYSLKKYFPDNTNEREAILANYRMRYDSIKKELTPEDRFRYGLFLRMPGVNKVIKQMMGARKI